MRFAKFRLLYFIFIFALLILSQNACISYLYQAAQGQWDILSDNIPIDEMVANPEKHHLRAEKLQKLKDVVAVQKFATNELGLKGKKNYRKYKQLEGRYPSFQVSAAEALRFKPITWYFPIAGRVPYLGYFDKKDQLKKARELKAKGYDVRIANIIAYSTLGWFSDPLLSSMLFLKREDLINIIIHEMAHATIYFPGDTGFNESVATFLGDEGTKLYLLAQKNEDSKKLIANINDRRHDQKIFSGHVKKLISKLDVLYKSDLPDETKLKRKAEYFEESKRSFQKIKKQFRTKRYLRFGDPGLKLNNAHLLSFKRYFLDLDIFYEGYALFDKDYKKYLEFLQKIRKKKRAKGQNYKNLLQSEIDSIKSVRQKDSKNKLLKTNS